MISYEDVKAKEFSFLYLFFYLLQQLVGTYIVLSLIMMTVYVLVVALTLPYKFFIYLFSRRRDADLFIFGEPVFHNAAQLESIIASASSSDKKKN